MRKPVEQSNESVPETDGLGRGNMAEHRKTEDLLHTARLMIARHVPGEMEHEEFSDLVEAIIPKAAQAGWLEGGDVNWRDLVLAALESIRPDLVPRDFTRPTTRPEGRDPNWPRRRRRSENPLGVDHPSEGAMCSRCRKFRPKTREFWYWRHRHRYGKTYLERDSYCRDCRRVINREFYRRTHGLPNPPHSLRPTPQDARRCPYCGNVFRTPASKRTHIHYKHRDES